LQIISHIGAGIAAGGDELVEGLQPGGRSDREVAGQVALAQLELANCIASAPKMKVTEHQLVVDILPVTLPNRKWSQNVDRIFVTALA
jgi:hypothetical protein